MRLCLSMRRPFQGAQNRPHTCVMAKALVYWLTVATHKNQGIKDEKRHWWTPLLERAQISTWMHPLLVEKKCSKMLYRLPFMLESKYLQSFPGRPWLSSPNLLPWWNPPPSTFRCHSLFSSPDLWQRLCTCPHFHNLNLFLVGSCAWPLHCLHRYNRTASRIIYQRWDKLSPTHVKQIKTDTFFIFMLKLLLKGQMFCILFCQW